MSVLAVLRLPDPLLKQPTRPVGKITDDIKELIAAMIITMRKHPRCVGLAAPQVGSHLRIAVMDASEHPKVKASHGLLVLVNPRLSLEGDSIIQREGCLSVPDFTANVRRVDCLSLAALDQDGISREWHLEGFEAIVAQHEVDHLDGLLFLDRVVNLKTDVFRRKNYL